MQRAARIDGAVAAEALVSSPFLETEKFPTPPTSTMHSEISLMAKTDTSSKYR